MNEIPENVLGNEITLGALKLLVRPYPGKEPRILSDETIVTPNQLIGILDTTPQVPMIEGESPIQRVRTRLLPGIKEALASLAKLCRNDDPRLQGVNAFGNNSRLARGAGILGFDTFDIPDEREKKKATGTSGMIEDLVAARPRRDASKLKPAQEALISRKKLVDNF